MPILFVICSAVYTPLSANSILVINHSESRSQLEYTDIKSNKIFKNAQIQFILNIISILVVYILKLSIIYALCLTLTYQVISYFMLFIGLNEIFYEKKA